MEKLLIIDGHNLLFKMFFGIPGKILNKNGKVVNGILGFSGAVFKLIQQINPDYTLVVFDSEQQLDRTKLNSEYKANRVDYSTIQEIDNPYSQIGFIEDFLHYTKIKFIYASGGIEADDIIASIALQHKNIHSYIVSNDNDFFQLVNNHISVVHYKNPQSIVFDIQAVKDKYLVHPSTLPLYKALVGDTADNIKGISKIGKITAQNLINNYTTLDEIYNNIHQLKPAIQNSLIAEKQTLLTNLELVTLQINDSVNYNLSDFTTNTKINERSSSAILKELNIF